MGRASKCAYTIQWTVYTSALCGFGPNETKFSSVSTYNDDGETNHSVHLRDTISNVRLTKSRDGTNGMAISSFSEPSVFDSSCEIGDITGFYMIDVEGVLQSVDVSAKFVNRKPSRIEAKYIMRSPREWKKSTELQL